ncbi:hypothetical protein [Halobacillus salinus]|uniref:Uncharacterized protein n=1 Tax=Halobacillus salinus TaxID=192814 RepID=A0A4Z0GZ85_9BACI|nr:hypothetical protein [Halobacillus salinus]TGB03498.1 hypothetical protein E4663_00375 [Halobacillus salinus]
MIKDTGSLRVRVRPTYLPLYKQLLKSRQIRQHSEFFTTCCFLPGPSERVDMGNITELCQANSFTDYQLTALSSLGYKKSQRILEPNELFEMMEKEADAGMTFLITELWHDLVNLNQDEDVTLIPGQEFEAQVRLIKFVQGKLEEVPF